MRVLHIGLSSHYTEGMLYQDNILSEINARNGHTVVFVTDTYCYKNGAVKEVEQEAKVLSNGVRLIRIKYDKVFNKFVTRKIMKTGLLNRIMNEFKPNTILYYKGLLIDDVSDTNKDIIIWGHSWEIEELNCWDRLEKNMAFVKKECKDEVVYYDELFSKTGIE